MAKRPVRQTMFTSGEIDPELFKRSDLSSIYLTGAKSLLNMEVATTGYATKRKGMYQRFNATEYDLITKTVSLEFIDKNQNRYIVLISNEMSHILSVSTSGTISYVQELDTPYLTDTLIYIDYTRENDSLILTHGSYAPARIFVSNYSPLTFSYEVLDIYPLPGYDFGKVLYNAYTVSLSVSGSTLTFQITAPSGSTGFNNDWIGGQIQGPGSGSGDISSIGFAIITAVSNSGSTTTFTATVQSPFLTSGYPISGSQYVILQPAWNSTLGYPSKVLFFQNRLWFANTASLHTTIFASKIGQPVNFDVGSGLESDAIVYNLGIRDAGSILWINGGKQLEIYCENIECVCPQDQNSALTPGSFSIRQQSSYGSSPKLKPISYLNDSYFVSKTGKAIINFHFNGVGLAYSSTPVSVVSSHLVKNPVNACLLRGSVDKQDNFIYFLNPDNTLTSFQFAIEKKLAALTPVVFQEDVQTIDIVTVLNSIFVLKYYSLTEKYILEQFSSDIFIDFAKNANTTSHGLITGLTEYNGYNVQVVINNQDYGQYMVEDGQITVRNVSVIEAATIGLLYNNEVVTMDFYSGNSTYAYFKQISRIYVDYYQSLDFNINGKLVNYRYFSDIQNEIPISPKDGTAIVASVDGFNRSSNLTITQNSPFGLNITGITYEVRATNI